ncbi:ABC transporter substrate-binding protein [Natronolimnohabitans innermongolicus]|uniref:ABC-type dipeptide transport system, periplasmic component n=1 Tax=Natronolimnohabitans innermongolicus JCM 12255 TaxID=1227499 RepID=L9X593_9EURY|nr:ABC transporter substrate-binding protein [Natronolimnohabitans innermongolicus]ELY56621.1 ABC-type dipeptide transport system, periplasmic component [Natronolimnohabitans innermongolicus JCM 12255]
MTKSYSRRHVLAGVGVGLGALAGCLGDSMDGESITVARSDTSQDGQWGVYGGVIPYYTRVFEPLVGTSAEMEPEPLLATDWERTDETTWQFSLREDVTFHNGAALTADDVVASFEATIDHWEATGWINVEPDGVSALDDHTVEFETVEPFPTLPGTISHNYFGIVHSDTDEDDDTAIGTGPFRLEDRSGDDVTLVPYEDHWDVVPAVEELQLDVVGDPTTRVQALEGTDADVALEPPRSAVSRLEEAEGTTTDSQLTPRTCFGAINIYKEPTDDETLRRALAYAVDQETIVDSVLEGVGEPARGPISPEIPWAIHDELPAFGPDLEAARDLVDESNYDGETLSILIDGDEPDDRNVAEILQDRFDEIGVDSEITSVESAAFMETLTDGEAHVSIATLGSNSAAADYLVRAMFHSEGSDNKQLYEEEGTGVMNLGSEVDELIEEGYRADGLEAKRELYGEVQERVVEAGVVLPLYYLEYVVAHETELTGPTLHPVSAMTDFTELDRLDE